MYAFKYQKLSSVADAAAALAKNPDAKLMAGGQTLIASMKLRLAKPSDVLDLGTVPSLAGVKIDGAGNVTVGAMTRHADVANNAQVKANIPALAALAGGIGDRMVRNMGTVGGSVANNDPAADYPAAVLGLYAVVTTNKRNIAADGFFRGIFDTALEPGEVITEITFHKPKRAAYMKFKNPASRYALVGVFVADGAQGPRVAVTGAGPVVFRVPEMEKALAAKFAPESVANIKVPQSGLNSDIHASAEYRAHLVTVMAKRAVEAALK